MVVTGGGSGIGRATVKLLAEAGAQVAIIERDHSHIKQVLAEIGGEKKGHVAIEADIRSEEKMKKAYGAIGAKWDKIDVLVANAGINGVWAPLDKIRASEWDETIEINLRGTFLTVKLALPLMREKGGSIVIVASINGTRVFSNSGATAYSCSKAAQVAFAKMTALELARNKIRVNAVCPGAIETNIDDSVVRRDLENLHLPVEFPEGDVPLNDGHPGSAHQVAQLIWFLASDASSHMTGSEIFIEGAQSLLQG